MILCNKAFTHTLLKTDKFTLRCTQYLNSNKIDIWIDFPTYKGALLGAGTTLTNAIKNGVKRCEIQSDNPKNNFNWMIAKQTIEKFI